VPFETAEERASYVSVTRGFGEWWSKGATTFEAIFDDEDSDALGLEGTKPMLQVTVEQIAAVPLARNDTITRAEDSQNYVIRELEPDGTGYTTLILEKA
jgi:hypothetical protein